MFEIEFRSVFDKDKYDSLKVLLDKNAECLGLDDKDCVYYIFADKLLKVVRNISKNDAKISLKLNKIGEGASFEEMELHFKAGDFDLAKKIINNLIPDVRHREDAQQRINYIFKSCEIALKYSEGWGYHAEIEKVITDKSEQADAEKQIRKVADELGIKLLNEDELKEIVRRHEG